VEVAGEPVWVIIAAAGRCKYLKIAADAAQPESLLALPSCP
jgi:hypothetical protein